MTKKEIIINSGCPTCGGHLKEDLYTEHDGIVSQLYYCCYCHRHHEDYVLLEKMEERIKENLRKLDMEQSSYRGVF